MLLAVPWLLAPALAAPDDAFTVVALPDTQYYSCGCNGGQPETFSAQTAWVVDALSERDIGFVTQLGDCVENGDGIPEEWAVPDAAFSLLEDPDTTGLAEGIPYGIAVGNHDQTPFGDAQGTTDHYNATFGTARFAEKSWYGDHYGDNNDNHYQLFSGGGIQYLALHLEYDPNADPDVLAWAADVLAAHPDRMAIVISHYLIDTAAAWGPQGQAIYDALKDQPTLFLMLSGHVLGVAQRSDTWDGRTVHTLLSDYQGEPNGGNGWLRILTLSHSADTLTVETWSPTLGTRDDTPENAFTLTVDLAAGVEPQDSGTPTDTPPDSDTPTDSNTSTVDSDPNTDADPTDPQDTDTTGTGDPEAGGCGCAATPTAPGWLVLLGAAGWLRRRTRAPG